MERLSLRELKRRVTTDPDAFEVHVQLEQILTKTSRSGKPYLEVNLVDAEDHLIVRAWEDTGLFTQLGMLESGDFIRLTADWIRHEPFGIEPKNAAATVLDAEAIQHLLQGPPELRERQAHDFAAIEDFVANMADPRLKGLCQLFLDQFGDRLRRTAAARHYHHARRGGLVEHYAQMMRSAHAICGVYPNLNRDLLLAGVLFHDCGKLWENAYGERDFVMPFTEAGELLGHIPIGMEIVNKLWRELQERPESLHWSKAVPSNDHVRLHLLHLVGSHHGEMAFGSPVVPKTPEAAALHYIDNLDAKIEMFDGAYATQPLLAKNIFERKFPLQGNEVRPLDPFQDGSTG